MVCLFSCDNELYMDCLKCGKYVMLSCDDSKYIFFFICLRIVVFRRTTKISAYSANRSCISTPVIS